MTQCAQDNTKLPTMASASLGLPRLRQVSLEMDLGQRLLCYGKVYLDSLQLLCLANERRVLKCMHLDILDIPTYALWICVTRKLLPITMKS